MNANANVKTQHTHTPHETADAPRWTHMSLETLRILDREWTDAPRWTHTPRWTCSAAGRAGLRQEVSRLAPLQVYNDPPTRTRLYARFPSCGWAGGTLPGEQPEPTGTPTGIGKIPNVRPCHARLSIFPSFLVRSIKTSCAVLAFPAAAARPAEHRLMRHSLV